MHCSVIEHGYDVIEFSNCSIEERGVSTTSYVLTALEHSHVLYFPDMENAMRCSLIMHGFHNGKWLILCSNRNYSTTRETFSSRTCIETIYSIAIPGVPKKYTTLYRCCSTLKPDI